MTIIPAIDLRDGRCVRLLHGDFARETAYGDDPTAIAARYAEWGFRYLHTVDLDGARTGEQSNRDVVQRIVDETPFEVQLGGGLRTRDALAAWFDAGIRRAVVGSVAVADAARVRGWLSDFGPDRLVLALDCRLDDDGIPRLATHGWTRDSGASLWDCIDGYRDTGLRHVLCTDVGRDGALTGPSLPLYRELVDRYPEVELQASGGVRDVDDLRRLRELGAAGAITGRALLDGRIAADEVSSFLRGA